jgi:hypothetical protein
MGNPGWYFWRPVSFLARLILIGLCLSAFRTPASAVELGKPPPFPRDLTGLELPEMEKAPGGVEVFPGVPLSVNPQDREASRQFFNTYYLAAPTPNIGWTGDRDTCKAGSTALNFRDATLLRINFFRALAGVPAQMAFSDTYSGKDQKAALMMSVNGTLHHDPPSSWKCYSDEGHEAAGKSNLALGSCSWEAINIYMADPGVGNGFAGHRRWLLYPQTQHMGIGDLPSTGGWAANALWAYDEHIWDSRPATREEYVAWPPPGYVPYQVVYPRWSFAYAGADFTGATVAMTENGKAVTTAKELVMNGYGENTLVWIPKGLDSFASWPQPAKDTVYRVTITDVKISGSPRSFTYLVTVFDPATSLVAMRSLPWLLLLLKE